MAATYSFNSPDELFTHLRSDKRSEEDVYEIKYKVNGAEDIFLEDCFYTQGEKTYVTDSSVIGQCVLTEGCLFAKTIFEQALEFKKDINSDQYVGFWKCEFNQEIKFSEIKLDVEITFISCAFKNGCDFEGASINKSVMILFNEIVGRLNFSLSKIDAGVNVNSLICDNVELNFESARLNKNSVIRLTNIIPSAKMDKTYENVLTLSHSVIEGFVDIQDSCFDKVIAKGATVTRNINESGLRIHKRLDRQTARLFKNEALKLKNTITAIGYRVQEMHAYRKELERNIRSGKIRYIPEWILVSLNTVSNNNGRSWARGVLFTIAVWLLFFCGFVILRDGFGTEFILSSPYYQKDLVSYLWLPSGFEGLFPKTSADTSLVSLSWLAIIVFLIGKILIAYGIYQTISAFRKHGRIS